MKPLELKKINKQLTKGLLDLVVLGLLRSETMHGYKIITSIRRSFGIYLGPSTIYPFLNDLEEKGYIKSQWNLNHDRPRKVYSLTSEGSSLLMGSEQSFNSMVLKLNRLGMSRLSSINGTRNNVMIDRVGI